MPNLPINLFAGNTLISTSNPQTGAAAHILGTIALIAILSVLTSFIITRIIRHTLIRH